MKQYFTCKPGILNLRFVGIYCGLKSIGVGFNLVVLFLGYITFFDKFCIATGFYTCIF